MSLTEPRADRPEPSTQPRRSLIGADIDARFAARRPGAGRDPLQSFADAAESPDEGDRLMAQAFSRLDRMSDALRKLSEELAAERRRNAELRSEVWRLRQQLAASTERHRAEGVVTRS
jgi:hypothetical protein